LTAQPLSTPGGRGSDIDFLVEFREADVRQLLRSDRVSGETLRKEGDAARLSTSGDAVPVAERVARFFNIGAFAVSESGTLVYRPATALQTQLVWVDRAGRPVGIAAPPAAYMDVALAPDDKRVVFSRFGPTGSWDVWLMDLQRGITSRFTFQPPINNVPVWSPDGRTVAFASNRNGGLDIYQRPSNASGPDEPLLKLNAPPIVFPS
jgi:dipeptidyl aminopeptidase/acylaminoacyl peptidase